MSFAAHPEWYRTREGARLRWLCRQSAAKARTVITISEFSRREIVEHLGIADTRVRVIPPGIPDRRVAALHGASLRRAGAAPAVCRIHLQPAPRAWISFARLRPWHATHPGASLDLAGDNRSFPREDVAGAIADEGAGDRIRWHQYVSDEQLSDLYGRARAFAFLSEYEGLGLTPLEALAAGAPPVLLDTPVARESCGTAALYVAHTDRRSISQALEQILFDKATRARLLAAAPEALARYSWPRAGRDTLAAIEHSARM